MESAHGDVMTKTVTKTNKASKATKATKASKTAEPEKDRSPLARAITSCLVSGNDRLRSLALELIGEAAEKGNRNARDAALHLGVGERTFRSWLEDDEVRKITGIDRTYIRTPVK
jgi:hypothetical protein